MMASNSDGISSAVMPSTGDVTEQSETVASMASSPSMVSTPLASVSVSVKVALNISFPRCSICCTGWYDPVEEAKDDGGVLSNDDSQAGEFKPPANEVHFTSTDGNFGNHSNLPSFRNDVASLTESNRKRKRRRRPLHWNLFPMPKCQCITRLAVPPLPLNVVFAKPRPRTARKNVSFAGQTPANRPSLTVTPS